MLRLSRAPALLLALFLALAPVIGRAEDQAAVPLETRAAVHPGFARLVFAPPEGGKAVPFSTSSDGTTLTLKFQAPIKAGLDGVRRALSGYLGELTLSADGTVVTAKLLRPVAPHQAMDGSSSY